MSDNAANQLAAVPVTITPQQFSRPIEVARLAKCSTTCVKEIADRKFPNMLRLTDGTRLFSPEQVRQLCAEVERRRIEALK